MPDTLKAQHIARLTAGYVLYSDMGRVLCSVVADSVGWHDTITGMATRRARRARSTATGSYQELRNDFYRNTRDNFLVELGKHGLGKRDMVANVNFFVKVVASTSEGNARAGGHAQAGRLRRAARRAEHAGRAVEHAAPARPEHRATRPSRSRSSCARGAPAGRTTLAACRGPRTSAASR